MAFGVIKLTRKQRFGIGIAFVILDIVQASLGFLMTIWSTYVCIKVAPKLHSETSEIRFVFTVIGIFGTHISIHALIGIKICHKCYYRAYKKSTRHLLLIWMLAGFNILANILILIVMSRNILRHILSALKRSLEKGIYYYLKDPFWKFAIDNVQFEMKCCGVTSHKDWYKIVWMDEYRINLEADLVKQLRLSETKLQLPITPWSCCRVDFPMQCLHDPLQQTESAYLWSEEPTVIENSIYNSGCLTVLKRPIELAMTAFIVISTFALLIMIAMILISRIFYTSCRNALILNDPTGIAPGWIFKRRDRGWARSQEYAKIMEIPSNNASITNSSNRSTKKSRLLSKFSKIGERFKKSKSDEDPVSSGDEQALMLK